MQTFNDRLEALTLKGIDAEIEQLRANLGNGTAKDFADYKRTAGMIAGLNTAKSILATALAECKKT